MNLIYPNVIGNFLNNSRPLQQKQDFINPFCQLYSQYDTTNLPSIAIVEKI